MRILVIGCDGLVPELLFGAEEHEGSAALLASSAFGLLDEILPLDARTCWSVLRNGSDAGALGLYGRVDRSGRADLDLVGNPPAPDILRAALAGRGAVELRNDDFDGLAGESLASAVLRGFDSAFARIESFLAADEGDLVTFMDSGLARVQAAHPAFLDDEEELALVKTLYARLDEGLGRIAAAMRDDDIILVVAPASVQISTGVFHLNEWLLAEGYLALHERPSVEASLAEVAIDWAKTRAFALGGAEGRIYLNLVGRDGQGAVPMNEASALREDLIARLGSLAAADGTPIQTLVLKPEDCFDELQGVAPDLLVVLDGHAIPVVERIAVSPRLPHEMTEVGLVAGQGGSFLLRIPGSLLEGEIPAARLEDLLPTLLQAAGRAEASAMSGRSLLDGLDGEGGRDRHSDEEAAKRRLRGLGYL